MNEEIIEEQIDEYLVGEVSNEHFHKPWLKAHMMALLPKLLSSAQADERKRIVEVVEKLRVHTPKEVAEMNRGLGNPMEEHAYHHALGYWEATDAVLDTLAQEKEV